MENLSAC